MDLLGRLSTNDLAPLSGGRAVATLFLSPAGRLLFRVVLQPLDDGLRAIAEPAAGLPEWVDRYTFAEDARLVPEIGLACVLALGPGAARLDEGVTAGWAGGARATGRRVGRVPAALVTGPSPDAPLLPPAAWTLLRVLACEPGAGAELGDEYHPLEAGLAHEISFTKGCYTGQEVVARQDSRGKVARRLVVIAADAPPVAGEPFDADMKEGCRVTTVAPEPDASLGWLALAYVGARWEAPGTRLVTRSGVAARVVEAPLR